MQVELSVHVGQSISWLGEDVVTDNFDSKADPLVVRPVFPFFYPPTQPPLSAMWA